MRGAALCCPLHAVERLAKTTSSHLDFTLIRCHHLQQCVFLTVCRGSELICATEYLYSDQYLNFPYVSVVPQFPC